MLMEKLLLISVDLGSCPSKDLWKDLSKENVPSAIIHAI